MKKKLCLVIGVLMLLLMGCEGKDTNNDIINSERPVNKQTEEEHNNKYLTYYGKDYNIVKYEGFVCSDKAIYGNINEDENTEKYLMSLFKAKDKLVGYYYDGDDCILVVNYKDYDQNVKDIVSQLKTVDNLYFAKSYYNMDDLSEIYKCELTRLASEDDYFTEETSEEGMNFTFEISESDAKIGDKSYFWQLFILVDDEDVEDRYFYYFVSTYNGSSYILTCENYDKYYCIEAMNSDLVNL